MIINLKLKMKRHKTIQRSYMLPTTSTTKSGELISITFAYWNSNHKKIKQSSYIIRDNLLILKMYMSFRFCHFVLHLYYVTSYFVVFDWKNLQNEQLYTLIPVPIICCTLTTKIFPFSDLHITLHMEQVHY